MGNKWVWRKNRNYFNSLPSIFYMVYSNTSPECKIEQWSLVIQPSGTPALNENHASEETCAENLTIFSILFNLHGEEERINVQKGRIFFIIWKIIQKKKSVVFFFFFYACGRVGSRGISLLFLLLACIHLRDVHRMSSPRPSTLTLQETLLMPTWRAGQQVEQGLGFNSRFNIVGHFYPLVCKYLLICTKPNLWVLPDPSADMGNGRRRKCHRETRAGQEGVEAIGESQAELQPPRWTYNQPVNS